MHYTLATHIDAPPERVWPIIADVERWPEWTASISSVELVEGDALAVGARARVRQPKLPPVVWTVTRLEPGCFFEWQVRSAGSSSVAGHQVEVDGDGSRVTLTLTQEGLMKPFLWLFYRGLTQRYLEMEGNGLKARAEAG